MATQLKQTDFANPAPTQAPNIRVAFSAGPAMVAVRDALATKPDAHKTLEELTVADLARGVIATAHELLSPRMFTAFLAWGEAASRYSTTFLDDGVRDLLHDYSEAVQTLASVPVLNAHDVALKQYLLAIETTASPCFGPLSFDQGESTRNGDVLIRNLRQEMIPISPLTTQIDALATQAWALSDSDAAWCKAIGKPITSIFSEARSVDNVEREYGRQQPLDLSGYDVWMRGPLIAWNRRYDRYLEARTERQRYYSEVVTPGAQRWDAVRSKYPADHDFSSDIEGRAALDAVAYDADEEHHDQLIGVEHDELVQLLRQVAPGAGELATKLALFRNEEMWTVPDCRVMLDPMIADARRFAGKGPHLPSDSQLLNAFSSRQDATRALRDPLDDRDRAEADVTAAEAIIFSERATTVEGVIAKLRIIFLHISDWDWSDRSITNPKHRDFIEGLSQAGGNDQALWSAIEDLARIGGVSLAEQGR